MYQHNSDMVSRHLYCNKQNCTSMKLVLMICCTIAIQFVLLPSADAKICSGDAMRAYGSCVQENQPCPCSSKCDINPTDGTPVNFVKAPLNCADIYEIFCPFVRCCSKCESLAYGWYQCSADNVAERWLQTSCDLKTNCPLYPANDKTTDAKDECLASAVNRTNTSTTKPVVPLADNSTETSRNTTMPDSLKKEAAASSSISVSVERGIILLLTLGISALSMI